VYPVLSLWGDPQGLTEPMSKPIPNDEMKSLDSGRIQVLQKQIADLRKRMPKHSISIAMLMELDDLEEELEKALSKSGRGLFLP